MSVTIAAVHEDASTEMPGQVVEVQGTAAVGDEVFFFITPGSTPTSYGNLS